MTQVHTQVDECAEEMRAQCSEQTPVAVPPSLVAQSSRRVRQQEAPGGWGHVPARGGVGPALCCTALLLPRGQGHRGRRVCLCNGHLFGLGGLLPTVGTVAGIIDSRGTGFVETMRNAALRLTFHKITLKMGRQQVILTGTKMQKSK